jgi:hypothetical protein
MMERLPSEDASKNVAQKSQGQQGCRKVYEYGVEFLWSARRQPLQRLVFFGHFECNGDLSPIRDAGNQNTQLARRPRLAVKIAAVVIHPRMFNARVFIHRPMIFRFVVINMIINIKTGVESP